MYDDLNHATHIEHRLDINALDISEVICSASRGDQLETVEYALQLLDPSRHACTSILGQALTDAANSNGSKVIAFLLNNDTHVIEAEFMFHATGIACSKGYLATIKTLLNSCGALLNDADYEAALQISAEQGHHEVVSFLMDFIPQDMKSVVVEKACKIAAGNGLTDVVLTLLPYVKSSTASIDIMNSSLNVAAQNGHRAVAELMLSEGADAHVQVEQVRSPKQNLQPTAYEAECDVHGPSNALQAAFWGWLNRFHISTLWRTADSWSMEETILLLLDKGMDVNTPTLNGTTPLHIAAVDFSPRTVQKMIEKGADINAMLPSQKSVLQAAASRGREAARVLLMLLDAGAAVPAHDGPGIHPILESSLKSFSGRESIFLSRKPIKEILEDGPGANVKLLLQRLPSESAQAEGYGLLLHMASITGDIEFVKLLIQRGVNVDATGYYYGSALQAAARIGNMDVARLLLDAGADVNLLGGRHVSALRAAATGGHMDVIELLVAHGADVNLKLAKTSESILAIAMKTGKQAVFERILEAGADIQGDASADQHILIAACSSGEKQIIKLLLDKGVDVNISGQASNTDTLQSEETSPLHIACSTGRVEVVQLLLNHGADVNKEVGASSTPIQVAASFGHWDIVELLIQSGAEIGYGNNKLALMGAASKGHTRVVQGLLRYGMAICEPPLVPNALAAACRAGQYDVTRVLLEELVDTEIEQEALSEAESAACSVRNNKALQMLLDYDLAPTVRTLTGACAAGLTGAVRMLLRSGIDVNGDDGYGGCPLHTAAYYQRIDIVELLCEASADPNRHSIKYGDPLRSVLEGCLGFNIRKTDEWRFQTPEHLDRAKTIAIKLPSNQDYGMIEYDEEVKDLTRAQSIYQASGIIQTLLDHGGKFTGDAGMFGNYLHLASYLGMDKLIETLVGDGMDVNSCSGFLELPYWQQFWANISQLRNFCFKQAPTSTMDLMSMGASYMQHAATAAKTFNGVTEPDEILQLLLDTQERLQITESDLAAAIRRDLRAFDKKCYLEMFFEHNKSLSVTEAVILAILNDSGGVSNRRLTRLLKLALTRYQSSAITSTMLKTVSCPKVLQVLLRHPKVCQITPAILESAAGKDCGLDLLELFLNYDVRVRVNEAVILAALRQDSDGRALEKGTSILQLLWPRYQGADVTTSMLESAQFPSDMTFLLERAPDRIVTPVTVEAASRHKEGAKLVELLLHTAKTAGDDAGLVTAAVTQEAFSKQYPDNVAFIRVLLKHGLSVPLEEPLLCYMERSVNEQEIREVVELLAKHDVKVAFTEEGRRRIDRRLSRRALKEVKETVYALERKLT
ncbi:hypothetical protein H2199_007371 [Coniosporium tulheliwenetii]|uniref:Uncharacterized protein n=1 Tax=Coniosporium tulheliwenetii TaxID=3383036 RepID=A0ACC2YRE1_9PEZI|nr:hypothetical protein H2199_007371 [Cladosporium sp. JES 115]